MTSKEHFKKSHEIAKAIKHGRMPLFNHQMKQICLHHLLMALKKG